MFAPFFWHFRRFSMVFSTFLEFTVRPSPNNYLFGGPIKTAHMVMALLRCSIHGRLGSTMRCHSTIELLAKRFSGYCGILECAGVPDTVGTVENGTRPHMRGKVLQSPIVCRRT